MQIENSLLESALSQQLYAQAASRSWAIASAFAELGTRSVSESFSSVMEVPAGSTAATTRSSSANRDSCANPCHTKLLPCVCKYLVCYFRRLSEIYGVYYVLHRQAMDTAPRAEMPPRAILRACAFLWSHALAPYTQQVHVPLGTSALGHEAESAGGNESVPGAALGAVFLSLVPPCWRLPSWWNESQAAMELPHVQKCLALYGVKLFRRPKGIRAFSVLRLLAEAGLQLNALKVRRYARWTYYATPTKAYE